jgi:hypothetical protein
MLVSAVMTCIKEIRSTICDTVLIDTTFFRIIALGYSSTGGSRGGFSASCM